MKRNESGTSAAAGASSPSAADEHVPVLAAFEGYGLEIEYVIVDRDRLDVRPLADELLCIGAGRPAADVERGPMGWSNELALHVLEVKNRAPAPALEPLLDAFRAELAEIDRLLAPMGARLMPGGMHPWMDPTTETRLWAHENRAIYTAYDRIFDCRRHGWGNVQSIHLNLPFADDTEFARLHAAVRLVLPLVPALAASSPLADGKLTGFLDYRLEMYRAHQDRLPSSMGECIPRPSASPAEYRAQILAPMYREVAEYGDAGLLQHEWLNARAAIPRFDRNAIEIRAIDVQECPTADLAVAALIAATVRLLYETLPESPAPEATPRTASLAHVFRACIRNGERALVEDADYLAQLGLGRQTRRAGEAWSRLAERLFAENRLAVDWLPAVTTILERGPLARRITNSLDEDAGLPQMRDIYRELCDCLREDRMFDGRS